MAIAIAAVTESSVNNAGTSHLVNLPAGGAAADLYLLVGSIGSTAATLNALANWTELLDENAAIGLKILIYTGAGVPTDPTFTSSGSTRSAWIAYRLTGVDKSITPQIATTGTGTSATPDPPSATPTGGTSKEYLFIAFAGMAGEEADDDTWGNTPPTNYTPSPPRQKACGTVGTNLGGLILSAERLLTTGAAQDPGTFGVDVSAAWRSQHIIVHPLETHSGTGASSNTTPRATATGAKGGTSTATETNTAPRAVATGQKKGTSAATASNAPPRATATGAKSGTSAATATNTPPRCTASGTKNAARASVVGLNHGPPDLVLHTESDWISDMWDDEFAAYDVAGGLLTPDWDDPAQFGELSWVVPGGLDGRAISIENVSEITGAPGDAIYMIVSSRKSTDPEIRFVYQFQLAGGQLEMDGFHVEPGPDTNPLNTTIAYDHATMRYWRVRSEGDAVILETSPDRVAWTARGTATADGYHAPTGDVTVYLGWVGEAGATGGAFDNFQLESNGEPTVTATGAVTETHSGSASSTAATRATASGAKGGTGAATASETQHVTATAGAATRAGSAAAAAAAQATATGQKNATNSATASNTGPRATATGLKGGVSVATASNTGPRVTATGQLGGTSAATASAAPRATASGAKGGTGAATCSAQPQVTGTGSEGSQTVVTASARATATATGAKGGQGAATVSAKPRATGTIADRFSGDGSASATPTCASSGQKGGVSSAAASAAAAATASGQKHASSTATVSAAAEVTGRHVQTATGSASATAAAQASTSGAKGGRSAVSAAETSEASASGAKTGTAAATASARGTTTAVGTRTASGAATATARAAATASGAKNATGDASATAAAVVAGTALVVVVGSSAVSSTTPRVTAAGGRTVTVTYGTILEGAGAGRVRSASDYSGVRGIRSDPPTVVD